jgi:hypothetical protein
MAQWFLTKYKFQQAIDDSQVGTRNEEFLKTKVVTVTLLIDAVSFSDAEARTVETAAENGNPDVEITKDIRFALADLFRFDTGDTWYLGKVEYILKDEKTGKQKRTPVKMLLNASGHKEAGERLEQKLKSSLDPYEIIDVAKARIDQVVEYNYK